MTDRLPEQNRVESRLLTYQQAAIYLNLKYRTVLRLKEEGRLPFVAIGKFVRFDPIQLDRWIDTQTVRERQSV